MFTIKEIYNLPSVDLFAFFRLFWRVQGMDIV